MASIAHWVPRPTRLMAYASFIAAVTLANSAAAQTMNANSAAFNAGFGRTAGEENRPVNVQLTDANGNFTLVNGLIQSNAAGSLFGEVKGAVGGGFSGLGGALDTATGAASGSAASAIGNNLNVVVQGDNNTVIVSATQTNTGAVTATSTTNGK